MQLMIRDAKERERESEREKGVLGALTRVDARERRENPRKVAPVFAI